MYLFLFCTRIPIIHQTKPKQMKKFFALLTIAGMFFFFGCGSASQEAAAEEVEVIEQVAEEGLEEVEEVAEDAAAEAEEVID
jgi:hypothetical protein